MKKKSHGIKKAHELLKVASQQLHKAAVATYSHGRIFGKP